MLLPNLLEFLVCPCQMLPSRRIRPLALAATVQFHLRKRPNSNRKSKAYSRNQFHSRKFEGQARSMRCDRKFEFDPVRCILTRFECYEMRHGLLGQLPVELFDLILQAFFVVFPLSGLDLAV